MISKFLLWRLLPAFILISIVIFAGSYGAVQVSSRSAAQIVYIPFVGVASGEEEPPVDPTPRPTPRPTPGPTPEPTPTDSPVEENVFFISPTGNDANDGATESKAWATFSRAWKDLYPGDTLIMLDGVYHQTLKPGVRNGTKDNPITIRAQNDGQAFIDGDGVRSEVVKLGGGWEGEPGQRPVGDYFILEGIVARNAGTHSIGNVILIKGSGNVLRRVSAYDAHTDTNSGVIKITGEYNLVEDCVAAGTGRKMIHTLGDHNIFRRCLADWRGHDSRLWHDCWPWGDGIEIYNASNNTIENVISYSRNPTYAIHLQSQGPGSLAVNNKILGSMAVLAGMKEDGVTPMEPEWLGPRPGPTQYTCVRNFDWPGQMSGFHVYEGDAQVSDNLWQDILAWGNAGVGLGWLRGPTGHPASGNNQINRATIFNNGLNNSNVWGGNGTDAVQDDLDRYTSINNSYIETIYTDEGYSSMSGEGARLTHRYIDGVLTNEPLWPWPMEDRIQAELGYSITDIMHDIFSQIP